MSSTAARAAERTASRDSPAAIPTDSTIPSATRTQANARRPIAPSSSTRPGAGRLQGLGRRGHLRGGRGADHLDLAFALGAADLDEAETGREGERRDRRRRERGGGVGRRGGRDELSGMDAEAGLRLAGDRVEALAVAPGRRRSRNHAPAVKLRERGDQRGGLADVLRESEECDPARARAQEGVGQRGGGRQRAGLPERAANAPASDRGGAAGRAPPRRAPGRSRCRSSTASAWRGPRRRAPRRKRKSPCRRTGPPRRRERRARSRPRCPRHWPR